MPAALIALLFGLVFDACQQLPAGALGAGQVTSKIEIVVPADVAELKIDGRVIVATGRTRHFDTQPLKTGTTATHVFEVKWMPNRYTVLFRKTSATFKAGENVTVDLTKGMPGDRSEVMYVPTPPDIVWEMVNLARVGRDDVVYELGCGDGRMVISAVKDGGAKKGVGIDIDTVLVQTARANAKQAGVADRVEIRKGDIFDDEATAGLAEATVVMLYMGDETNLLLRPKLLRTLKPGARIVSHQFLMGDWKPDRTETITGPDETTYLLHLWVVKESDKQ